MFNLKGKKALVTGASRGIGKGIALALAEQGADVVVNYYSSEQEANELVTEIKNMGCEAFTAKADVSDSKAVKEMFSKVKEKWGKLDILVNNAGVGKTAPFMELSEEMWDTVLNINLKGVFLCSQQGVKLMPEDGRIINITSILSGGVGAGFPAASAYSASKGGVVALTENMALELAEKKITVNAVGPGFIKTDMTEQALSDPQTKQALLTRIALNRIGNTKEIGAVVAFLASEEASYVTGATLYADGGWLAS